MKVMSKKQVAKEIRRTTKADGNCYICDEEVTETHHIVKVSVLTGIVLKFNAEINKLLIPVVALCPTHHTKLHILAEDRKGECNINDYEKARYEEIIDMADYMNDEEYSDVYNYAVDRMKDMVLNNLEREVE